MKKRGIVDTIIKVGILAAGIGGTLYLFKDKIEENPKCKDAVDKLKRKVKEFASEQADSMEDIDPFDEDFDEIIHATTPSGERGYVNIKLSSDPEDTEESQQTETVSDPVKEEIDADAVADDNMES